MLLLYFHNLILQYSFFGLHFDIATVISPNSGHFGTMVIVPYLDPLECPILGSFVKSMFVEITLI